MPQPQRGTITDRLADVIQVVQLGRKSGRLTAERGEGPTFEQGSILFAHGQVTDARANHLSGQSALSKLSSWGMCYFTFVPATATQVTSPLKATPPALPIRMNGDTDPRPRTQPLGTRGTTEPLTNARDQFLARLEPWPELVPHRIRQYDDALHIIERAGLSRAHRRLLLLIDGQRSLTEITRLMGRGQDEVSRLLQDLKQTGLIY